MLRGWKIKRHKRLDAIVFADVMDFVCASAADVAQYLFGVLWRFLLV